MQGFAEVVMPDNYIVLFPGIDKDKAKNIVEKADPFINQILADIRNGNRFSAASHTGIVGKLESSDMINSIFYTLLVRAKGFHVNETRCVSCGKCVELCPLNNIILTDGKPIWGNDCTHCMACLHRCPTEAIGLIIVIQKVSRLPRATAGFFVFALIFKRLGEGNLTFVTKCITL